jgi:ABC-type nitrate/sulfonate/bicarbonate transport system substrate-binding protein
MTNKKFWIFGVIIVALLIISTIIFQPENESADNEEQQKATVTIGQSSGSLNSFPLFVAREMGFFSEYNLEVQFRELESNIAVSALLAKEIDYFTFLREGVMASLKGAPIKTITTFAGSSSFALVTQPDLELNDIKTVGIAHWLAPPHYLALKVIKENNLSAEIIASGSMPATTALLTTKKVDATVRGPLPALQLRDEGYKILTIFGDEIPQGLVTTDDKIKNNPEEIEKVSKAVQASIEFIKNNPEETKELLFAFLELEKNMTNQGRVEELYSISRDGFETGGTPSREQIEIVIKLGKAGNYETIQDIEKQTVTEEDIATAFDFSLVK